METQCARGGLSECRVRAETDFGGTTALGVCDGVGLALFDVGLLNTLVSLAGDLMADLKVGVLVRRDLAFVHGKLLLVFSTADSRLVVDVASRASTATAAATGALEEAGASLSLSGVSTLEAGEIVATVLSQAA